MIITTKINRNGINANIVAILFVSSSIIMLNH